MQAAHLTLLSTKYKHTDAQTTVESDAFKGESVDAIKDSLVTLDHSEDGLTAKHEEDDLRHDSHFDEENG